MINLRELIDSPSRRTLGLMSGTSADGVDLALCHVNLERQTLKTLACGTIGYPPSLKRQILEIGERDSVAPAEIAALSRRLGDVYADAVIEFLKRENTDIEGIDLIGSHGQTIAHQVRSRERLSSWGTLQLGDGDVIAKKLGIVVVSDFRWADIAVNGRGAPLSPIYHRYRFAEAGKTRLVINIGGIANLSLLQGLEVVAATDTGPGNCLSDYLMRRLHNRDYDHGGSVALSGTINRELLARMQADEIFGRSLPMALDRPEMISILRRQEIEMPADAATRADLVTTIAELTVWALRRAVESISPDCSIAEVIVCGGGVHNQYMMRRLAVLFPGSRLATSEVFGSRADFVEAECFAYLANLTLAGEPGNLTNVTGALRSVVLGKISQP